MDLKGLPQTVQNFIEETIQNRENGKFPDNETCQKVMEYAADTGSQKLAGLGLYYLAEYYWQNDQYENTLQCLTESIGYLKNHLGSRCIHLYCVRDHHIHPAHQPERQYHRPNQH